MRAAVYYNNNDVRLEERPKPVCGPGELLVKVTASGICGSDVLEWYRIRKAPVVLGHEIAGVVEETGAGVKIFRTGDRVAVSHHVPCNTCRYCLAGNHTVCETLHTTNFDPGGFAEYVRVPAINVDRGTFVLPDHLSFEAGTFVEPLGCVVRAQRTAGITQDQTVLILGSGISGLLHILLARATGVARIIATDVNAFRLGKAAEFGADAVINAGENVPLRVREINQGRGADIVVICTGALPAFKQALQSVDRAGTVVCFATLEPGIELSIPVNEFWRNSVKVMSSYAASPRDLAVALDLMGMGRIDIAPMITHRLPLADTGKGFRLMTGPTDSLKVIIEPE